MSDDIRSKIGLRPVINVSGTMTGLGASIVVPEAIEAMTKILPQFVEINDLQRKASAVIARLTGGGGLRHGILLFRHQPRGCGYDHRPGSARHRKTA